jgi:hypothetical protein
LSPFSVIGVARAQGVSADYICDEGGFVSQFATSAKEYLTGETGSNSLQYHVVVWSTKSLDTAKQVAGKVAESSDQWHASVGCRRPDNPYFPVMLGAKTNQVEAAKLLGRFQEAGILTEKPYLSAYPFREPIYTPD